MRAEFNLFRDLLGRMPRGMALEWKEAQEYWLISKDHFLQAQESSIPMSRKSNKGRRWHASMRKELLTQLRHKTEGAGEGDPGGRQKCFPVVQG